MADLHEIRVAMLQSNAINESLGLCDLSAHLKAAGAETRLFLRREDRNLPARLREFAPRAVVIPCDLLGHNGALALTRLAKQALPATPTILGGTHPTFFHNIILQPGVDFAFAGEAEGVVDDLLAAIRDKRDPSGIPNLIVRADGGCRPNPLRPVVPDLDLMPLPDRELYFRYPFMSRFPAKKFATGRGCLNSCGFCFNPSYRAMLDIGPRFFRRKSPNRVAREINEVRARHRLDIVHFSDDLFSSGREWIASFAEVYRAKVRLPFSCNTFASALDEKTVAVLRDAGCRILSIGVEVADDRVRREVMNKPVDNERIARAAAAVKKAGIQLVTFNILGVPWNPPDGDLNLLEMNQRLGVDHARVTQLAPFPFSRLTARLIADGFLAADYEARIEETPDLPRWPPASLFRRPDPHGMARLHALWNMFVRFRTPMPRVRRLVNSRWATVLAPISAAVGLLAEKRLFGLGWIDGLRHFRHIIGPAHKTSNYVSFI